MLRHLHKQAPAGDRHRKSHLMIKELRFRPMLVQREHFKLKSSLGPAGVTVFRVETQHISLRVRSFWQVAPSDVSLSARMRDRVESNLRPVKHQLLCSCFVINM